MKKALRILTLLMVFALLFSACATPTAEEGPAEEAAPAEEAEEVVEEKRVVGVSLLTREHTFYNLMEEGMVDEAKKLGYELIVMDANQDTNIQINQVQDFITQGVDAIVLCPTSSAGIAPAIEMADDAGISIFTMDIAAETGVVSHVATDNYAGGVLAGEYVADFLDGKGEVAIIACAGIESVTMREEGFTSVIDQYPDMEVVTVTNCECDAEKAANQAQDMLITYPDLALIFGAGDPFALGALASITAAGEDVWVMGFDALPEAVAEVEKDGLFIATIAQDPDKIARTTLQTIDKYLNGEEVEPLIAIAPYVVD